MRWTAGLKAAQILALPMCRRDMADYLGLTIETVSRALSNLQEQGILGFLGMNQRQIVLLDRRKLTSLDLQSAGVDRFAGLNSRMYRMQGIILPLTQGS